MRIRSVIAGIVVMVGLWSENQAQNLIQNPSFEAFTNCPKSRVYKQSGPFLPGWTVHETPDFFHQCSIHKSGVPSNFAGQLMPADGDGYVGIIVNVGNGKYVEYLEQELETPLQKDQLYCLTYYCARAANARVATTPPRISFSPNTLKPVTIATGKRSDVPKKVEKQLADAVLDFPLRDQVIEAADQWAGICVAYRGTGYEKFVRIGGAVLEDRPVKRLKYANPSSINGQAYYLIDHISLVPVDDLSACNCRKDRSLKIPIPEVVKPAESPAIDSPKMDTAVVMNGVTFATDQAELLPTSFDEIEKLLQLLLDFPEAHVRITGHTDNTGDEAENVMLSRNRAKAVVDYLMEKGIDSDRLRWNGYGSSVPVADNATEAGRQTNRRVEFELFTP